MIISIGADHGGFEYKEYIKQKLGAKYNFLDKGAFEYDSKDDYTGLSFSIAEDVASGKSDCGIMVCRTGVGPVIAMNKVKGIRAGLCESPKAARIARQKNNINIISFGADNVSKRKAIKILEVFLGTAFDGGRHAKRMNDISEYERKSL